MRWLPARGARGAMMACAVLLGACTSVSVPPGARSATAPATATSATKPAPVLLRGPQPTPSQSQALDSDSSVAGVPRLGSDATAGVDTGQNVLTTPVEPWSEQGIASWYGPRFHGRRTASGERFNTHELTAAHKTLPFGTRVRVTSLVNGKEVVVRINDRGPFIKGRIIDLSRAAALALGLTGIKQVQIQQLR